MQALGTLEYNSDVCPREVDQQSASGANAGSSSSLKWWETDSEESTTKWWEFFTSESDGKPSTQEYGIIGGAILVVCWPVALPFLLTVISAAILLPFAILLVSKYGFEALIAKLCGGQKTKVKKSKRKIRSEKVDIENPYHLNRDTDSSKR